MLRLGGKAVIVAACALIGSIVLTGVTYAGHSPAPAPFLAAPTNLVWQGGLLGGPPLQLHWDDNSSGEDGFRLKRVVAGEWIQVAMFSANATSGPLPLFTHDDWCSEIQLELVAYNAVGESLPSNVLYLPPYPSGCQSTATPSPTPGPTIAPSPSPTVTPAALPQAGGAPGSDSDSGALLAASVTLILGGGLALKRIR